MTIPSEKKQSLYKAYFFLMRLLDPKKTPRVPRAIRQEAYYALKHYPRDYDIEYLARKCPKILGGEK